MEKVGQERSMQAAVAPVPSPSAGLSRKPLPALGWRTWLIAISLALIVMYAFLPTLDNGFQAGWDDDENFLDNPYFRGLGTAQFKWAWTTFWVGAYQPLAWLLFECNMSSANSTHEVTTSPVCSSKLSTPWCCMS